ncbi:MAG: hypothetical protein JWL63_1158 [Rhodocyclales bacterium]|nr:hypothetical protein [Rhodocyclales bacterium]
MVIIERRLNPAEANVLQGALVAAGVPAVVDDSNTAHCLGYLGYALDGVRVRVPGDQAQLAREVIDDIAANRWMLDSDDAEPSLTIDEQRVLAYTQDESLVRKWSRSTPRLPGFMWSAFLFGSAWLFYRKLYRTGVAVFLAEALLLLAMSASGGFAHLWLFIFVAIRMLVACSAEALYYARSRTIIHREAHVHGDESALQRVLQQRGGISFPAGLFALLAHRLLTYAF